MPGLALAFIRTNVDSGGTPQQISSSYNNVRKAIFKAAYANAALLKIGLSAFTTHYFSLEAGQQQILENFDLSLLYVDGTTGDDLEVILLN
jgi:hypothetical protein